MRKSEFALRFVAISVVLALGQSLSGCGGGSSGSSSSPSAIAPVANACPREAAGSVVQNPPDLFSRNGVLTVTFSYQTTTDADGRNLFCFMTPSGLENPTLNVNPGDRLSINITNNTPATPLALPIDPPNCGSDHLTGSSLNIHFHGTNTSPTCHQDQVVRTLINSGKSYRYDIRFPADEPPGLYWYHPHAHMLTEAALQGGGSGVIVVQGIQNFQPAVAGLEQQVLVIRDQNVAGNPTPGGDIPSWDLTLNNIPIAYPQETPAVIKMTSGESQLWRVSNSSADSILDLQVLYDGVPQNLQIVALDGVPTGSQDGTRQGTIVNATDILIPTAGRAEFIVAAPPSTVTNASLVTLGINTGPDGDNDPQRTLATIQTLLTPAAGARASHELTQAIGPKWKQRFADLSATTPETSRTLYFSENNPLSEFYITAGDATPVLFDPNNPPAITTVQGSVEDWTIQNQTLENHEFHIHQIHFLVESQNNFEINGSQPNLSIQQQVIDTIQVPFWDGNPNHPYPSVTVRMDFRGADVGDFVYHCHIAEHEDDGMMAIIRVMPSSRVARTLERIQLYLASLEWPLDDRTLALRTSAWCLRGRIVRTSTRRFPRPQVSGVDPAEIKLRE
ncbi:MAG: multicopper oxidase domain-containing protein [Candidatus Binatus sp.]|jgi:FtsP/CotA-like multicopper oxidase with cupredoxin domain